MVLAHGANLPGAGVGAQDDARRGGVEAVLHLPRRVVVGEVEQLEVHLVRLDVGAAVDLEAHVAEDAVDFAQGAGDDVQAAVGGAAAGQGHVERPGGHLRAQFGRFGLGQPLVVGRLQLGLDLVEPAAERRPLFGAQRPQVARQQVDSALLAQRLAVPGGQRLASLGRGQGGGGLSIVVFQFFEHSTLSRCIALSEVRCTFRQLSRRCNALQKVRCTNKKRRGLRRVFRDSLLPAWLKRNRASRPSRRGTCSQKQSQKTSENDERSWTAY